jgi:hypothetical protein
MKLEGIIIGILLLSLMGAGINSIYTQYENHIPEYTYTSPAIEADTVDRLAELRKRFEPLHNNRYDFNMRMWLRDNPNTTYELAEAHRVMLWKKYSGYSKPMKGYSGTYNQETKRYEPTILSELRKEPSFIEEYAQRTAPIETPETIIEIKIVHR